MATSPRLPRITGFRAICLGGIVVFLLTAPAVAGPPVRTITLPFLHSIPIRTISILSSGSAANLSVALAPSVNLTTGAVQINVGVSRNVTGGATGIDYTAELGFDFDLKPHRNGTYNLTASWSTGWSATASGVNCGHHCPPISTGKAELESVIQVIKVPGYRLLASASQVIFSINSVAPTKSSSSGSFASIVGVTLPVTSGVLYSVQVYLFLDVSMTSPNGSAPSSASIDLAGSNGGWFNSLTIS